MKRILVTGAGGAPAYNYIKSLRDNPEAEEFYVVGLDKNKYHLELIDVNKKYLIPDLANDKDYISYVNKIISDEKIDFIHSQPEQDVLLFSENARSLKAKTFLPSYKTVSLCQNKIKFVDTLASKNLPTPQAYHINSEEEVDGLVSKILGNNEKAWIRAIRGAGSKASLPVNNAEQARMWIKYWIDMKGMTYEDFMVSEFLPGDEYAFQSVWKNGEIIMSQARKRIEYLFGNLFVSGQSSSPSVAMTVNNKAVNKIAYDAIKAIDEKASGIFCVDLKTDKNGKILITEINAGRFFTTSYFFSKAGCNMPYYYTKIGLGDIDKAPCKQFDNLPEGFFWLRMVDMGYKLVKNKVWMNQVK
jgi:predicted ATP-grasp superfamily ATP-dependent carboligase